MRVEDWLDSELGVDIWEKKYRCGDETFDQWLDRVSGGNQKVRDLIIQKKFLFGGRILSNRGLNKNGKKVTYSNCYVLAPPEDSIEGIFETASKLARTFSFGGGVGIDLSKLRPTGASVNNTAETTSGAVSFMDLYSMVTELIGQNGRRGALMLSMSCEHPDIEEFIDVKMDLDKVTKANLSIRVTDEFMESVISNSDYELKFECEDGKLITKTVNARSILEKLSSNNWEMGEPAILYWDRITNWNMLSGYDDFEFAGLNPCAEEPLPAGGSCLLGSINLSEFVIDGEFDFDDFASCVSTSVVALNEVLDEGLALHPLQEQRDSVRDWRQIGLGIFGLADMLIKMKVSYGSVESLIISNKIASEMLNMAVKTSSILADMEGSFPKFNLENTLKSRFLQDNLSVDTVKLIEKYGLRNSQLLTIAPTGTLSTMLGVSGGIEPIFANSYTRKTESLHGEDRYYKVYTPIVKECMDKNGLMDDSQLPKYFVTAKNLHYANRIEMQGTWQKYIDASISSTINVPEEFSKEDIFRIYVLAMEHGLKGCTVYRDNCSRVGILTTNTNDKVSAKTNDDVSLSKWDYNNLPWGTVIKADNDVIGKKRKLTSGCGSLYLLAYFDEVTGRLLETYIPKGSSGTCISNLTAISRLTSTLSRAGVPFDTIIDQLSSCETCTSYCVRRATKNDVSKGSSCPVALGYALREMQEEILSELYDDTEVDVTNDEVVASSITGGTINGGQIKVNKASCPECGEALEFSGGCNQCRSCGYTKCN